MFKKVFIPFTAVALFFAQQAYAVDASQNIMVIAKPDQITATTMGANLYYSKGFELFVTNMGQDEVDLSSGCFVGYDGDNRAYSLDIIDEDLSAAKLSNNQNISGTVAFSDQTNSVYNVQFVRFQTNCN